MALALSCVTAAGGASQTTRPAPSAREPEVVAAGNAEIRIPPTFALVMIAVSTRAGNAAEAASQNAAKVASTINALRQAGLASEDITTQGYSLEQAYEDGGRRRGGFTARNALNVRVNRIDQVGAVIDAAIRGGATDISSIQYGSSNMEDARRTAMGNAVKQARADAALIASAAGGTLGRLISITSTAATPPIYGQVQLQAAALMSGSPASPTVISPRDLTAIAYASGRWEFIPGSSR